MREIFTAKGYEVGSNYDRYGLKYAVVAEGEPTWISLEKEDGEVTLYQENAQGVIHQIDEKTYQPVGDDLNEEELKKLQDTVFEIVNRDMVELGLLDEEADDRVFIYLASWRNYIKGVHKIEITQEDIDAELEEIRPLTKKELIHRTAQLGMEIAANKNGGQPVLEQIELIFQWLVDQARKKQIIPMEDIIEKYDQIKDLVEQYQLDVVAIGLTPQQASEITVDQSQYLKDLYVQGYVDEVGEKMDFSPEEMQELYLEVVTLFYEYQLNAFGMGVALEVAENISEEQSDYLLSVYAAALENGENEASPSEAVIAEYERIKTLSKAYQIYAFNTGISLNQAQEISQNQAEYLLEICGGVGGETPEMARINYAQVEKLPYRYQITAFLLGLSPEQAQSISKRNSDYLMEIFNEAQASQIEISAEEMQQILQEIEKLPTFQKRAFDSGLPYEVAANLTQSQFNEISAMSRSRVEDPTEGESLEEAQRKSFLNAYQIFSQSAAISVAADEDE